jgi:hypothetical protein
MQRLPFLAMRAVSSSEKLPAKKSKEGDGSE